MSKKNKSVKNAKTDLTQKGWIIVSVVALILSGGLIAKLAINTDNAPIKANRNALNESPSIAIKDARIQLVASRFRCACGGCGELPLDECTCDMPRGAVEEKNFIRDKLAQGLTIDEVVNAVNEKYGHIES